MVDVKYGVYIGRFQPLHLGHQCVINEIYHMGLEPFIVVGSSREKRTINNPLSMNERMNLIFSIYTYINHIGIPDQDKDSDWFDSVIDNIPKNSVIVGHKKIQDRCTYNINGREYHNKHYLDIFEEVYNIPVIEANYHNMLGIDISATDIRNDLEGNRHYLDYRVYNKMKEIYG